MYELNVFGNFNPPQCTSKLICYLSISSNRYYNTYKEHISTIQILFFYRRVLEDINLTILTHSQRIKSGLSSFSVAKHLKQRIIN